jgi:hypothetical protein
MAGAVRDSLHACRELEPVDVIQMVRMRRKMDQSPVGAFGNDFRAGDELLPCPFSPSLEREVLYLEGVVVI